MKLVNPNWSRQIELQENTIPVIVIENKQMFRELIIDLKNQLDDKDGNIMIEDSGEALKISKYVELIFEYVSLAFNDKKILTKLYNNLRTKAIEEYESYSEIVQSISNYIEGLIIDEAISLAQIKNIDPIDLFKGVALEIEDSSLSELEKVLEYISLMESIFNIRIFIFVNIKVYFSGAELKALYDTLLNRKVNFFLIESNNLGIVDSREKFYIFDEDCCEI